MPQWKAFVVVVKGLAIHSLTQVLGKVVYVTHVVVAAILIACANSVILGIIANACVGAAANL